MKKAASPIPERPHRRREAWRAGVVAAATTSLEWYDFFIYATATAVVFNVTFFATEDPTTATINSFATLAVGSVARPLGGIVAGHFGDRVGRKPVLVAGTILMGGATTLVGFVPSTQIVWLAPLILVVLRLCQGLAVGAQWGGAVLMATEYAPPNRRGLYGSFAQIGIPIGLVLGNAVFMIASSTLDPDQFLSWGWRIPFWLSALILVLAYGIHRYMEDTPEFRSVERSLAQKPRQKSSALQVLRKHPMLIIAAAGTYLVGIVVFYTTVTSALQYATVICGVDRSTALLIVLVSTAVCIPLTPLCAYLSDIYGRKLIYGIGIVAMSAWAIPAWLLLAQSSQSNLWPMILAVGVSTVTMSFQQGTQAALFAELFPPEIRFSGATIGYSLASLLGGFSPMVAVILVDGQPQNGWRVGIFISVLGVFALACLRAISTLRQGRFVPASTPNIFDSQRV
ncbi:MFS transporter [Nocardia fusca]|uniref:MFS transporter n=1 Tax=Nocardia fusca TaxID=941183 RepID=UPI0007A73022|nr:MFS transporter [Nocardia fusca]